MPCNLFPNSFPDPSLTNFSNNHLPRPIVTFCIRFRHPGKLLSFRSIDPHSRDAMWIFGSRRITVLPRYIFSMLTDRMLLNSPGSRGASPCEVKYRKRISLRIYSKSRNTKIYFECNSIASSTSRPGRGGRRVRLSQKHAKGPVTVFLSQTLPSAPLRIGLKLPGTISNHIHYPI
jgi:hypothetical protein